MSVSVNTQTITLLVRDNPAPTLLVQDSTSPTLVTREEKTIIITTPGGLQGPAAGTVFLLDVTGVGGIVGQKVRSADGITLLSATADTDTITVTVTVGADGGADYFLRCE